MPTNDETTGSALSRRWQERSDCAKTTVAKLAQSAAGLLMPPIELSSLREQIGGPKKGGAYLWQRAWEPTVGRLCFAEGEPPYGRLPDLRALRGGSRSRLSSWRAACALAVASSKSA